MVNELETAFKAGDGLVELGDSAIEFVDGPFAAEKLIGGAAHGLDFAEFGREGAGFGNVIDEGEVPLDGNAGVEALDLPLGDGDVADNGQGELVGGVVDFDELFEHLVVLWAVLIAQDGLVRREKLGEFVDVFAGFDGVGADFGFACVGDRTLGFGAVFSGDSGSFFVRHIFLSWVLKST